MAELRQIFGFWYALYLFGLLGVLALARTNGGDVLLLSFDGDAVHMADIVLRLADGQTPHLDFQTPLGVMAFLPIVWLVNFGAGLGAAFAYGPVLLGLLALPAVFWVGTSRLRPSAAFAFGAVFYVQLLAYVHGGTEATVSAAMYYNNWCWAFAALIVLMVVLPRRRESGVARWIEPVFLGCAMGFLMLSKVTFAVFLLPAVILSLLLTKNRALLGFGVLVCIAFLAVFTIPFGGIGYWSGFIGDLIFVAQSSVRAQPGDGVAIMVLRPAQIVGVVGLIAGFVFLRQARLQVQSLIFLLLGLGWILISNQNWQNDPHWLIPAGLVLLGMSRGIELYNRFGWPIRGALQTVSVLFFVAGAPLLVTQAQSLLVHNGLKAGQFSTAMLDPRANGLKFRAVENAHYAVKTGNAALSSKSLEPVVFMGTELPVCEKLDGLIAELVQTGRALDGFAHTQGKQVLYADWVNALPLFSRSAPLMGGAPWYYGSAAGFENAEFLVVPKCPMGQAVRNLILAQISEDADLAFREVGQTPLFILYERQR